MYNRRGDRAISQIIGAMLVAVILLGLLTMYQVYGVPAENEAIEFEHSQEVRGDVLDVRNALIEAKRTGTTTTASVDLAPRYPTRLIAMNPAHPTGSLRTGPNGSVSVLEGGTTAVDVCPVDQRTKPVIYEGQYNVYADAPTMRFENTVAYADFDGTVRPISGQQLVQGDRVEILLTQGDYRESGSGTASFDALAGRIEDSRVDDPTVTVPTALGESDWETLLDGEVAPADVTVTAGNLTLDLTGTYTVSCGVVGAGEVPPGGVRPSGGSADVNPAGPGNLELVDAEILAGGGKKAKRNIRITFNSTASELINATKARISFYYDNNPNKPITEADLFDSPTPGTDYRATLVIQDPSIELTQPISFAAGDRRDVSLTFNNDLDNRDFFVLKLTLDDGQSGTYFVGME